MFDKLGQLKDLWKLKGQMEEMKKRLDAMVIKAESPRHWVSVTFNGSMEVKEVTVDPISKNYSEAELAEEIKAAFNKGLRDCQMMAAQSFSNNLSMPHA